MLICLAMDLYKNWLWFRTESVLPTTFQPISSSNSYPSFSNGFAYLRHRILGTGEDNVIQDQLQSREAMQFNQRKVHQKNFTPSKLVPISFPSYLNSGGCTNSKQIPQKRRSSLYEGTEQMVQLLTNDVKQTKLALPRNSPSQSVVKQSQVNPHLPIPIVPLRKFKVAGTLYGYLDEQALKKDTGRQSTRTSVIIIITIFLSAAALIFTIYQNFPEMEPQEREKIKLPKNVDDAQQLGRVLSKYKDSNYYEVMAAFFVTYIFLQTFAIPGSVFLSILSGFLYPFYIALFLVCLCSGIGATGCYMISYFIGKPLVNKYLADRMQRWLVVVDGQREHIFNYLLFLRITPFLPNWFINIVSPVIHIPVSKFFFATFIGVAPLSFIAIEAGTTLYQLTTAGDAFSWTGILIMGFLAILSIVPVIFKNTLKSKFE